MDEHSTDTDTGAALKSIAWNIQRWLDWQAQEQRPPNMDGDSALITLPVPFWPNRSQLEYWVMTLKKAAERINANPD